MYVRLYQAEQEYVEEMEPFSEDDLSLLYPNAQLDNQSILVDAFIRVRNFLCCVIADKGSLAKTS